MIKHKEVRSILKNQKGVALMMVLSTIMILTTLMYTFRFDTGINKIKAANYQSKIQAKLNAEAGLKLALLRLEIFQQISNTIEKNQDLKKMVNSQVINMVWNTPLAFPLPVLPSMSVIEKSAIDKFEAQSLLNGSMTITIESLAHKINLNLLRLSMFTDYQKGIDPNKNRTSTENDESSGDPTEEIEDRLKDLLSTAILKKSEEDELFLQKYSGIRVEELIAAIKFYVSDERRDIGTYGTQIEAEFNNRKLTAKHAPLTSLSELYLLPGWNDELVDLIKNEITVHGDPIIDLNKLTANLLRMLIPDIPLQKITEYFKLRNHPENPLLFNKIEDFKNYFVEEARIISATDLDDRLKLFEKAGIKFSNSPQLFKVISVGAHQSLQYTVEAIVTMGTQSAANQGTTTGTRTPGGGNEQGRQQNGEQNQTTQLLIPKVVEITIY